jgi:hypothetical protein
MTVAVEIGSAPPQQPVCAQSAQINDNAMIVDTTVIQQDSHADMIMSNLHCDSARNVSTPLIVIPQLRASLKREWSSSS